MSLMELQPFVTEREWMVDGIPVLAAQVSVPEPTHTEDRISRRIRRYYQLQCRSYLRYCEKWLFPQAAAEYQAALASSTPLPCFRAELSYQITYHNEQFLSLYTQSRELTLPGHTLMTRRGDTWNLVTGYPVPVSDWFPPRHPWKRILISWAEEEIQRQERAGISCYHDTWQKNLRRYLNPQNYYLAPGGLTYFFPMYALAPAVEGIPTFTFPYGKVGLKNILVSEPTPQK